jgi:hypothetical protein
MGSVDGNLHTNEQVNYRQLIGIAKGAKQLAEWIICSGGIGQFTLARSLLNS